MRVIRYTNEMIDEFSLNGYWTEETFYDFWKRNAEKWPDQEALVDSSYRITWKEAVELVDAIAGRWIEMGFKKDTRIIVQSPNSVYGFLARIASERAGLIALTVYPYLRHKELEESSPKLVETSSGLFRFMLPFGSFYENLKLEYPVLWAGMKSFPAEGRGKCVMNCT